MKTSTFYTIFIFLYVSLLVLPGYGLANENSNLIKLDKNTYGPVITGDTLSNIAYTIYPDGSLQTEQIMWAIYNNNPDAFVKNNISVLKQGVILNIPERAEITATSPEIAKQNINTLLQQNTKQNRQLKEQIQSIKKRFATQQSEREKLKTRLQEMETKIQLLLKQNSQKDAELKNIQKQLAN